MPRHAERKSLPYRPDQMFDLIADVEKYPEFLPWCLGARILSRTPTEIRAELVIGFRFYRERFTSIVTLDRPGRIDTRYADGPFEYLENHWAFEPAPDGGTIVDFHVDFEFRSKILQRLIEGLFSEAVRRMVGAFEARARKLYGQGVSGAA